VPPKPKVAGSRPVVRFTKPWLCQLLEAGLLKASFVPPKPIRDLRNLARYRKTQIQERAREANRLHKALEDTGIKLDCDPPGLAWCEPRSRGGSRRTPTRPMSGRSARHRSDRDENQ
jgi:hypothetical protein